MLFLIHSGLLSFSAAVFISIMGILIWKMNRSVPVAMMNLGLVLLNVAFGVMDIVITHPGIWN